MLVKILNGKWGPRPIVNETFSLAKPGLHASKKGPFVLVNGEGKEGYPPRNFRIVVASPKDAKFEDLGDNMGLAHRKPSTNESVREETDTEIKKRLKERFEILNQMTIAAAEANVRGLIVSGAPGTGKSHEVEAALKEDSMVDMLSFNPDHPAQDKRRMNKKHEFRPRYTFMKGYMSAAGLYEMLFNYSQRGEVIVMDDCDRVWFDETSLNLMKAALDTTRERVLTWQTSDFRNSEIPRRFTYEGSLIVITNYNFEKMIHTSSKLAPHFEAMMDRCFYLDTTIDTLREKLIRIEQVAMDFGMLTSLGLERKESKEVMRFVMENAKDFRQLSLRKVVHLTELYKMGGDWKRRAQVTLLKAQK